MCDHILIVEDDLTIADMVSMNLGVAGYACTCAYTGPEALALVAKESYDIALLDVMLPGMDGFSLMPSLKDKGIPVIYVTAKNALEDKVRGLRMGAEDYLVKPFEMLELIVRIEKVLARNKPKTSNLTFLNVAMDMENRVVFLDGAEVVLTPIEYGLLRELLLHPRMTHTRERLLNLVWGDSFFGETRTVDVHIAYLRKKLGWGKVIVTVHKVGYRLEPNAFMGG
ncbi:MAG: response regulator transcription factor [Clostridia bacterium]